MTAEQGKNNLVKPLLLGIMVVVLVVVIVYQFSGLSSSTTPVEPPASGGGTASAPAAAAGSGTDTARATHLRKVDVDIDELLREIEVVTFDYQQERIDRNPMSPLIGYINTGGQEMTAQAPAENTLQVMRKKVSGIIYDPNNPVAVVDEEVVGIGHTYPSGVEVYDIEPKRVVFKVGDSLIPVELKEL